MTTKARPRSKVAEARSARRVLVVEDEQDLLDLLRYNLERDGFVVKCTKSGEDAWRVVQRERPDLIVLDLMLPGMDGLELCRRLKGDPQTDSVPVVMLTARGEESDIVVGLEMGADDYVVKPFSPRVLNARLRAVLRRHAPAETEERGAMRSGRLTVDADRHEVRIDDATVSLTHTEFLIVQALVRRPGRVFTRAQIVQASQGEHVAVTDRSVDVHIVSLRRKLGDVGGYIQTVRGVGYRCDAQ
ncbi:MAG: DNA-binding response regulator [Phycisphaeraceae bacterium]|nr:DNA-binding response regulator [Phycisphaeraceae bacterium]